MTRFFRVALVLTLPILIACPVFSVQLDEKVKLGIDVLTENRYKPLIDKRVGLLTHPAGVNRFGMSTIQVLHRDKRVNLVALFGPEHGIYGDAGADEPVQNTTDRKTGLPVFSLYGKYRRPSPEMLEKIDILVIDLQDIGVRSYTYVSAMRHAMEECFKNEVEVVVLDRPNPLGGWKVDGPVLESNLRSYVGAYPVPYVHGLTIGELALMAKDKDGWMDVDRKTRKNGKLTVVPMKDWSRDMMWPDTGLTWIPTSPAMPNLSAVLGYPMTGLGCQLGSFKHGYGTTYPFRLLTYPGKSALQIKQELGKRALSGLDYKIIRYRDTNGAYGQGVYITVTDYNKLRPTEISFHLMQLACQWSHENPFTTATEQETRLYNIHVGSNSWWQAIRREGQKTNIKAFLKKWSKDAEAFQKMSMTYHLYN